MKPHCIKSLHLPKAGCVEDTRQRRDRHVQPCCKQYVCRVGMCLEWWPAPPVRHPCRRGASAPPVLKLPPPLPPTLFTQASQHGPSPATTMTSVALLLFVMLGAASALPQPQGVRPYRVPQLLQRTYQADPYGQFQSRYVWITVVCYNVNNS